MGSRSSTIGCLRCPRSRGGWGILSCGRSSSVLPLLSGWLSLLCRRIVAVDILKGGIRDSAAVHAKFSLVDVFAGVQEFNFFRPSEPEEIELLHTCKDIYEGELGMYSCTVPYAPLEYVNNNNPPVEKREPPR